MGRHNQNLKKSSWSQHFVIFSLVFSLLQEPGNGQFCIVTYRTILLTKTKANILTKASIFLVLSWRVI